LTFTEKADVDPKTIITDQSISICSIRIEHSVSR
jgi:hypothetical protein